MRRRYTAGTAGVRPLRIQLGTTSSGLAEVCEVYALEMTPATSSSYPVLYRPSSAGTGSGTAEKINTSVDADSSVVTTFTTSPAVPSLSSHSAGAVRIWWRPPTGSGMILGASSYVVLYATAQAPSGQWAGQLTWEEF